MQLKPTQTRIFKTYLVFHIQIVPCLHQLHREGIYSFFGHVGRNLKQTKILKPTHHFSRYKS